MSEVGWDGQRRSRLSRERMMAGRERLSAALDSTLDRGFEPLEVPDTDEELKRQAALATRRNQKSAQERTAAAIGAKFADPREDPEMLQDHIDELYQNIFVLEAEIEDLEASRSMKFPSPTQVANVSSAVGLLEARIASSAAANGLMGAATAVIQAFPA